jgi:hypothetical protein
MACASIDDLVCVHADRIILYDGPVNRIPAFNVLIDSQILRAVYLWKHTACTSLSSLGAYIVISLRFCCGRR